ncbi:nuclear protein 96-domain-containing protein [Phlyctochytrium arcticum]|nr:nuclear protein 96-domain-containing protein [Phlyctochytrium arcticum]
MFGGGFGSSGFGQQQQRPATTGFGGMGGFGQQQQQQQPAQPATGFGGFGQPQQQQTGAFGQPSAFGASTTQTGFGAAAPATGGFGAATGGFGASTGTSLFGAAPTTQATGFGGGLGASTGAFGASTNTTSLFGQKPATTGFGGFGAAAQPATSGFGAAAAKPAFGSGFGTTPAVGGGGMFGGAAAGVTNDQVNNGTGNPAYAPAIERETAGGTPVSVHHISAMQAYKNWSPDELRWQDYQNGKKYAGAAPAAGGGFGGLSFGATSTAAPAFGSTPAFGQPATTTAAPSLFGGGLGQPQQQTNTGFGMTNTTTAGTGLFGQPAASTAPSLFGQAPAPTAFGQQQPSAFGAAAPATGGFGFGQQQQQQQQQKPAFGGFGQTTTGFGAAPAFGAATTTAGGLFGSTPATTAGGFGFGATPSTAAPAFGQQQQPAATGGFGFGANTGGGLFGQPAKPAAAPAFGGFGQPAASTQSSLFGSTPAATGTSLFGQPAATPSLFGQPASQPTQQPSLFGNTGGAFGQTNVGQPQQTGGLFGAQSKPAFNFSTPAATSAPGMGLFGQPAAPAGGSLFGQQPSFNLGAQPAPATNSLFVGAMTTAPLGSLFGNQQQQQQLQPSLRASIDKNPYGINPIFESPKKTTATLTPVHEEKKKPLLAPYAKVTAREASKIKLRGFGPSPMPKSPMPSGATRYESALGTPKDEASLGLDPRFTPRKSVRRLVIDEPTNGTPSGSAVGTPKGKTPAKGSVTFDPRLERSAVRQLGKEFVDVQAEDYGPTTPHTLRSSIGSSPGRRVASPGSFPGTPTPAGRPQQHHTTSPGTPGSTYVNEQGYEMEPPLRRLLRMSDEELRHVPNFKISLAGVGYIKWLEPVDLLEASPTKDRSGIEDIPGTIVTLAPKLATVYPDDTNKPPVGMGLNMRAEVALEQCWPIDKSTREYILEMSDPRHDRHIRKLESMPDTVFLGYHNETGTWKFEVDHFSRYGLVDDDDDDDVPIAQLQEATPPSSQEAQQSQQSHQSPSLKRASTGPINDKENFFFENAQVGAGHDSDTDLGATPKKAPLSAQRQPTLQRASSYRGAPPTSGKKRVFVDLIKVWEKEDRSMESTDDEQPDDSFSHLKGKSLLPDDDEENEGGPFEAEGSEPGMDAENGNILEDEEESAESAIEEEEEQFEEVEPEAEESDIGISAHDEHLEESDDGDSHAGNHLAASLSTPTRPPLSSRNRILTERVQRTKMSLFGDSPRRSTPAFTPRKTVSFDIPDSPTPHDSTPSRDWPSMQRASTIGGTPVKRLHLDLGAESDREDSVVAQSPMRRAGFGLHDDLGFTTPTLSAMEIDSAKHGIPRKYLKADSDVVPSTKPSAVPGKEEYVLRGGMSMSKTSRVGWGPGGMMVVIGAPSSRSPSFSKLSIEQVPVFGDQPHLETERKRHEATLKVVLNNIDIAKTLAGADEGYEYHVRDGNDAGVPSIPRAILDSSLDFARFVDATIAVDQLTDLRGFNQPIVFSTEETLTWKLASALWDPIPVAEGDYGSQELKFIESSLRREEVSRWLKTAVKTATARDAGNHPGIKKIFYLLAGRQMGQATVAAMSNKDFRLATILSQLGGPGSRVMAAPPGSGRHASRSTGGHGIPGAYGTDEIVTGNLGQQIKIWDAAEARGGCGLSPDYLNVWKLAAGKTPSWSTNMFTALSDWKRTFGLFFWYGEAGNWSLNDALETYEEGYESSIDFRAPLPAYLEDGTSQPTDLTNVPKDICYHLLRLFTRKDHLLEHTLQPLNMTPNELDHRMSWLLWRVLTDVKRVRTSADAKMESVYIRQPFQNPEDGSITQIDVLKVEARSARTADRLTRDFVWQLEVLGLWRWAIFVSLFFGSLAQRERAVRELLARWYPLTDDSGSWARKARPATSLTATSMDLDEPQHDPKGGDVSDDWHFLVNQLRIPAEWIHEARALQAKYQGNEYQECISLIDAKKYVTAHRLILHKIALEDVISEDYQYVRELLSQIPASMVDSSSWRRGGQLFLTYIELMDTVVPLVGQAREYTLAYSLHSRTVNRTAAASAGSALEISEETAQAARQRAQRMLAVNWVPKMRQLLTELAEVKTFAMPVGLDRAVTQLEGPVGDQDRYKREMIMHAVCRSEMAVRVTELLEDVQKVCKGGEHEIDQIFDADLLAALPLPSGPRVNILHKITAPLFNQQIAALVS